MNFAAPWFLFLLLPLLLPKLWRSRRTGTLIFSDGSRAKMPPPSPALQLSWVLKFFRGSALVFMIIALARPQWSMGQGGILPLSTEGVDIVLALDISGSMKAEDMSPNRVGAAKEVAERFVTGRTSDRIGLVAFAGEAYTQCPLTLDHAMLSGILRNLDVGYITDGTAIGMALAEAAARLKDSKAKSRVIILLTDGVNNRGAIDPTTAAQIVKALKIKVYTIGIGTKEGGRVPVGKDLFGRIIYSQEIMDLDQKLLQDIAETTGGKFYLARDAGSLQEVFSDIDRMEKSPFSWKTPRMHTEAYRVFLFPAFALLCAEVLLRTTRLRRFP